MLWCKVTAYWDKNSQEILKIENHKFTSEWDRKSQKYKQHSFTLQHNKLQGQKGFKKQKNRGGNRLAHEHIRWKLAEAGGCACRRRLARVELSGGGCDWQEQQHSSFLISPAGKWEAWAEGKPGTAVEHWGVAILEKIWD